MVSTAVVAIALALTLSSACASESQPWQKWCRDQTPKNYGMCTAETRADLPTVVADGKFEISWVRRPIGFDNPIEIEVGQAAKFWHSGIVIKEVGTAMVMLVQYDALNFEPNMFYPRVSDDRQIIWNNTAVVGWLPSLGELAWPLSIKMGVVSGTVLNKWFEWVPTWRAQHPHYQLFNVWDRFGMFPTLREKGQFFKDSCCHTFTEDALGVFHDVGTDFSAMTQPLCRNYFVLIQDTLHPVSTVGRGNADEWNKVVDFYDGLQHLVGSKVGSSISEWIKTWIGLVVKYGYTAYLADSDLSNYHLVHLSMPYSAYLLQRMRLPWQSGGNPRECWSKENVAVPQIVSEFYAANQTVIV